MVLEFFPLFLSENFAKKQKLNMQCICKDTDTRMDTVIDNLNDHSACNKSLKKELHPSNSSTLTLHQKINSTLITVLSTSFEND